MPKLPKQILTERKVYALKNVCSPSPFNNIKNIKVYLHIYKNIAEKYRPLCTYNKNIQRLDVIYFFLKNILFKSMLKD